MDWLWIIVVCAVVLIAGTTGVRVIVYEVRQARHARHVIRVTEADAEPDRHFYGSMTLPPRSHNELDWRERTMAELAPEALDYPGPGVSSPDSLPGPVWLCGPEQPHEKPAGTESAGSGHPALSMALPGPGVGDGTEWAVNAASPHAERLADTGDIRDAALLADTATYMRDQDADVADWLAGRAITWARLEIGALT